jgi:hypothetical protein
VEDGAAEAAAGIEHPRLGMETGRLQQAIVDILEARRAAAAPPAGVGTSSLLCIVNAAKRPR